MPLMLAMAIELDRPMIEPLQVLNQQPATTQQLHGCALKAAPQTPQSIAKQAQLHRR
jgi:hypothetical protein